MKIQTLESQVWWIAIADEIRPVRGADISAITAGLQSRFGFLSPPSEIKGGGIEFLNGRFAGGTHESLIARLSVFNDGINIQVPTDTEDAELILQDALAFLFELGVRKPMTAPVHFYQSTIVADFEAAIEQFLPNSLLEKLSNALPISGSSKLFSIGTNFDPVAIADPRWRGINPTVFRIERRASIPYELNRYFCLANLTTAAHLDVLSDFERFALKVG